MSQSKFDPKTMEFRHLGNSGLKVSLFSLGGWITLGGTVKGDPVKDVIKAAWDSGIQTFDLAEGYSDGQCEIEFGRVFRELGLNRREAVITTKIFWGQLGGQNPNALGLSRKHIIEGVDGSLERLGMSYVDVVFAHRADVSTPIEETVRAFNSVIESGKAFYWGTSEWSAAQIEEAVQTAKRLNLIAPICEQPKYNLFTRERFEVEYAPLYKHYGYGTTIFSPLEIGYLTGKYNQHTIPTGSRLDTAKNDDYIKTRVASFQSADSLEKIDKVDKLIVIAKELGCSVGNLSLAWCAKNPNISTVILGASRPEQVIENVKALEVIPKLTPEILKRIDEIFPAPAPAPTYGR